jgi:glycosyltransferase involved in cell wall biosynthesis
VHIITRMILGGAQENTLLTCQGLLEKGHQVLLLTGPTTGPEGELLAEARARGVEVEEISCLLRPVSLLRDWRAYCRLRERLRELAPQIVHTHSSKAGVLGRAAARAAGVRTVVHTIHGLPFHRYNNRLLNSIYISAEKFAAARCDRIISVADAMTRQAVAAGVAPPEKFVTIRSGMEIEPFVNAPRIRAELRERLGYGADDFVVVKLARLFELKGHDALLKAASQVVKQDNRLRLLFIGDGLLRGQLEATAEQLGLRERVHFAGLVPAREVPGYLAAGDLLVHASLREGLPRAVPQALLTGTPVVALDLDGAPEIVHDGQTGLLTPAGDTSALAAAILKMMTDPELAARTASAGRDLAARLFSAEKMVEAIVELYTELLPGRK